jgi:hypothetical protein
MSNTETVKVTVRYLRAGDVLAGSGFVVTRTPYPTVALRGSRNLVVEGFYPGGKTAARQWNRDTTVTILATPAPGSVGPDC